MHLGYNEIKWKTQFFSPTGHTWQVTATSDSTDVEHFCWCRKFARTALLWTLTDPAGGGQSALTAYGQVRARGSGNDLAHHYHHTSLGSRTVVKARGGG